MTEKTIAKERKTLRKDYREHDVQVTQTDGAGKRKFMQHFKVMLGAGEKHSHDQEILPIDVFEDELTEDVVAAYHKWHEAVVLQALSNAETDKKIENA